MRHLKEGRGAKSFIFVKLNFCDKSFVGTLKTAEKVFQSEKKTRKI